MKAITRVALGLVAVWASGCATNLASMQTARTLRPGQIRAGMGYGVYLPTTQVGNAVSTGIDLTSKAASAAIANKKVTVTDAEMDKMVTAGAALAAFPPSAGYEYTMRVGVFEDFDVGGKYSLNAVKLDGKYRIVHMGEQDVAEPPDEETHDSFDVAVGLGGTKYIFANPVVQLLDYVNMGNFDRYDLEVPVYISVDLGSHFGLYLVPKWIYSHVKFDEKLVSTAQECACHTGVDTTLPATVDVNFLGATAGLNAGWRRFKVFAEITAGHTFAKPFLFGKYRDLGGTTLYPSVGFAITFR